MKSTKRKWEKISGKTILFVVNTMGRAGAETALLELLEKMNGRGFEIFLYVLMGQGELMEKIPPYVRLLNSEISSESVLSKKGRRRLVLTVFRCFARNGGIFHKILSVIKNFACGTGKDNFQISKLLWRIVSDGAERFEHRFDLAIAWLEGGSAYYVSDHVMAGKKIAFIHIDYKNAGYKREMDQNCWRQFDWIYAISDGVKESFQEFYPEYMAKVKVFQNVINQEVIRRRAAEGEGFSDDFKGIRLLTVGRLDYQKGYDLAVDAMRILKGAGYPVRWYVLGEGPERRKLEKKIVALQLTEDFLLMGAVENPYPCYVQADIYVHATRFEGKSIAIQEAQTLGCAVIASDCTGNRELITSGKDGILCELTPQGIAEKIVYLLDNSEKRRALGRTAGEKKMSQGQELEMLLELLA